MIQIYHNYPDTLHTNIDENKKNSINFGSRTSLPRTFFKQPLLFDSVLPVLSGAWVRACERVLEARGA